MGWRSPPLHVFQRKIQIIMACNQTLAGIAKDCQPSMGGIKNVYCANKTDIASDGITVTEGKITGITMEASKKFKHYSFIRNNGSLSSTYAIDRNNGSSYVTSDLVLPFSRMDTAKRIEISALAQNELVVIVEDNNGAFWFLGYDEPVMASAGDGLTGTARADRNGYSITLQDNSREMPYEVDPTIVAGIVEE